MGLFVFSSYALFFLLLMDTALLALASSLGLPSSLGSTRGLYLPFLKWARPRPSAPVVNRDGSDTMASSSPSVVDAPSLFSPNHLGAFSFYGIVIEGRGDGESDGPSKETDKVAGEGDDGHSGAGDGSLVDNESGLRTKRQITEGQGFYRQFDEENGDDGRERTERFGRCRG